MPFDCVHERGAAEHAAASSFTAINTPSSFTPINRAPALPLTPCLTASPSARPPRQAPTPAGQPRVHHSAVSRYLGLGVDSVPSHLESYAPALPLTPDSPPAQRIRRRKRDTQTQASRPNIRNYPKKSRLIKARSTLAAEDASLGIDADGSRAPPHRTTSAANNIRKAAEQHSSQDTVGTLQQIRHDADREAEDDFDDGLQDSDFWMLDIDHSDGRTGVNSSSPSLHLSNRSNHVYTKFKYAATTNTALFRNQGTKVSSCAAPNTPREPIVRPPFPVPVRDRSPVIGLSSMTLLKTCFRIGEAINQGCRAVKNGQNVFLELYARIRSSSRDETRQHFVFCDLFHDKRPYLNAVFEAAIWENVVLFNYDSTRLLQEKKACRCIGQMKRNGNEWVMVVVNIWETTWEDIAWVEGIVNS